jgi:hypothetical protein
MREGVFSSLGLMLFIAIFYWAPICFLTKIKFSKIRAVRGWKYGARS